MILKYSTLPYADLLERIKAAVPDNVPIHLVGGAVRDWLLKRVSHDLDFVVPQEAISISRRVANRLGAPFIPIDQERDTGRVMATEVNGQRLILDFAAYRGPDLESDLRGRDFTINAMAIDLRQPQSLYDPLGGMKDLREGVLRACSDTAFGSDPIRILRIVRQAVEFGFRILPETRKLIQLAVTGLSQASPERQRDELFRLLDGIKPASALRTLDILGALDYVLPELSTLKGIAQSYPHTSNVWEHSITTTQALANILDVLSLKYDSQATTNFTLGLISIRLGRFRQFLHEHLSTSLNIDRSLRSLLLLAALYHDVGKPSNQHIQEDGHIRFRDHEHSGARLLTNRCVELRLSNVEISRLQLIVNNHMRPLSLVQADILPGRRTIYRFYRDCHEAGIDICLLSLADTLATYGPSIPQEIWTHHLDVIRILMEAYWEQNQEKVAPPTLLNGDELIRVFKLEPGPQIGRLLEAIRESQASGEVHDYDDAIKFARTFLEKE